jgi:FKBP-type peptidyl-prolyl cis-trans isomerase 2
MRKLNLAIIALIICLFFVAGCTTGNGDDVNTPNTNNDQNKTPNVYNNLDTLQKVQSGDNISVNYTGKLENGEVFDSSLLPGREPLTFDVGAGQMIKGFDAGVLGMKVGETKTITMPPEDGYGVSNPANIVTVDANQFADFDSFEVGGQVSSGNGATGVITAKTDTNATIDFNHNLAGKVLVFEVTIVSIN